MACSGTVYTYAQLEGLWINNGGPKAVAPVAAAIAEAESGGCVSALNPTDNDGRQTSVGLWQVSNGTHQYPAAWTTAAGNAAEAVAKYQGAGDSFSPWGTYETGAYKAFLNGSTTADLNVPGSSAAAGGGGCSPGQPCCLIGFSGVAGLGSVCFFTRSEARALIGGVLIVGSAAVGLVAAVILAAAAFQKTGALAKAADAAAVVPGGGAVAAGLTAAHARASRTGAGVTQGRERAARARQAGEARRARQAQAGERRERAVAERRERYERGMVTTEERTPLSGEMGGTRRTVTRRPGPRPAAA